MRLSSFATIGPKAAETFRRFPLPLLFALAATVAMICLVHENPAGNELLLVGRLAMTFYLGMLFSISASLYTERFVVTQSKKILLWAASLVLLAFYFSTLPSEIDGVTMARFGLLVVALHLLVAFAAFVVGSEMNGLWQFNKSLFIRILIGGVYSGFLYGGLALAILAIDKLFEVNIDEKFYTYLWFTIAGVFNTWFFLSGVPAKLPELERTTDYPKGLKIFTLYVLLPLITVYLAILYAYAAKILITSVWPVGWVANLVIAFSIFGILSFLLIYPLRDDEANPWVKTYSRLFYFLLVPLIVLLYVSIFKRINMYGITVERYLVVVLALWLSFIAAYFIVTSGKRIRVIPLSLCLIVLLSSCGPWGAFATSRRSQISELTALLEGNQVLADGKVDTTEIHEVKSEDYERIRSIVGYLGQMHGYKSLQPFFAQNIYSIIADDPVEKYSTRNNDYAILESMKIERIEAGDGNPTFFSYGMKERLMRSSEGYDFVTNFSSSEYEKNGDSTDIFVLEVDTVQLVFSEAKGNFSLTHRDFEPLVFDMNGMYAALPNHGDVELSAEQLTTVAENAQWKAKLVFSSLGISRENGESIPKESAGILMLTIRTAPNHSGAQ